MKQLLQYLSIAIAAIVLFSCNKESGAQTSIEGTWGLIHYETYTKIDDEFTDQTKFDCNPFAPVGDDDVKFVIFKTLENNYLITRYYWDDKKASWVAFDKTTWTINGDKLFINGNKERYTFSLTSDSLTLEMYDESDYDYLGFGIPTGTIKIEYEKMVFRKMADESI